MAPNKSQATKKLGKKIILTSEDNCAPHGKCIIWLKGIQMEKAIYLSTYCCIEHLSFINFNNFCMQKRSSYHGAFVNPI